MRRIWTRPKARRGGAGRGGAGWQLEGKLRNMAEEETAAEAEVFQARAALRDQWHHGR